ncbi:hypothetical protein [Alsobacter sp. R-9]
MSDAAEAETRDITEDPVYRQRPRPFGPEVTWRLEPETLYADSGLRNKRVPYRDIVAIRLTFAPTNITSHGFKAVIRLADGKTLTFGSLSWRTYFEVERQDADYRAFVTDLVARAGRANPAVELVAGKPRPVWLAATAVGALTGAGLAAAVLWGATQGAWTLSALALLFLVPFAWQAWGMATRNRPASFTPDAVPDAVLPGA